jgi:hypothetical protein
MASIIKRGPYQWQVKIRRKGWSRQAKTFEPHESSVNEKISTSILMHEYFQALLRVIRHPLCNSSRDQWTSNNC